MRFSKFIAYGDESGGSDKQFPFLGIALCVFPIEDYISEVVPRVQKLKFDHFGHDQVVLHESDYRERRNDKGEDTGGRGPFKFGSPEERAAFLVDLYALFSDVSMETIATVVNPETLRKAHGTQFSAYDLALRCCAEQMAEAIRGCDGANPDAEIRMVMESRSSKQDEEARSRFREGLKGEWSLASAPSPRVKLEFATKQANSAGLQIADGVARPIVLRVARRLQSNRAWDTIAPKMYPFGSDVLAGIAGLEGIAFVPDAKAPRPKPGRMRDAGRRLR